MDKEKYNEADRHETRDPSATPSTIAAVLRRCVGLACAGSAVGVYILARASARASSIADFALSGSGNKASVQNGQSLFVELVSSLIYGEHGYRLYRR
jgi:hypothetical protein